MIKTGSISTENRFIPVRKGWVLLLVSLNGFVSAAAEDTRTPPLSTIIQEVIARDEATQKALRTLQYHQVFYSEQLDQSDKVTKRQEVRMIVRPGATQEIEITYEKGDDIPANPDEATLQAQGKKAQKQKLNFPFKDLVDHYNVALGGTDLCQKQAVYVLSFTPKADQPYRDQTEKILNHLRGRLLVSTRDYTILQTDAGLAEPVQVAWIFATVSAFRFHYELNNTGGGFAPAHIVTSVQVNAPFLEIRQRLKVDIDQMEPRTESRIR